MNIFVLNGPNLNMLGKREPDIYGTQTYQDLELYIKEYCTNHNVQVDVKQTNYEGIMIDMIQYADDHYDAIVINAGAFTHYSYAIYDAIKAINIPVVEVHISDITTREDFRKISVIKDACVQTYMGFGFDSYIKAIEYLQKDVNNNDC